MYVVHDNRLFSLTKAQPSPTTDPGFATKFTAMFEKGQPLPSFNPIAVALAMGGTFIARGFTGETEHLTKLFMEGIKHRGFAFIDVLQPCVAWNFKNTWKWYRERIYKLEEDPTYDPTNYSLAFERSQEWGEKVPIGIFYKNPSKAPVYDDLIPAIKEETLVSRPLKTPNMKKILSKYKL
jgi:2-oxoglutarate ferredoxin oxidoreductase subunit beta